MPAGNRKKRGLLRQQMQDNPKMAAIKLKSQIRTGKRKSTYTARQGDSWFRIAGQQFADLFGEGESANVAAQRLAGELARANPHIKNLQPGQTIRLPWDRASSAAKKGNKGAYLSQSMLGSPQTAPQTGNVAGDTAGQQVILPGAQVSQPANFTQASNQRVQPVANQANMGSARGRAGAGTPQPRGGIPQQSAVGYQSVLPAGLGSMTGNQMLQPRQPTPYNPQAIQSLRPQPAPQGWLSKAAEVAANLFLNPEGLPGMNGPNYNISTTTRRPAHGAAGQKGRGMQDIRPAPGAQAPAGTVRGAQEQARGVQTGRPEVVGSAVQEKLRRMENSLGPKFGESMYDFMVRVTEAGGSQFTALPLETFFERGVKPLTIPMSVIQKYAREGNPINEQYLLALGYKLDPLYGYVRTGNTKVGQNNATGSGGGQNPYYKFGAKAPVARGGRGRKSGGGDETPSGGSWRRPASGYSGGRGYGESPLSAPLTSWRID